MQFYSWMNDSYEPDLSVSRKYKAQPAVRFPNEWLSEVDLLVNYRQNVTGTVKLINEWLLRVQSFNESNESKQMILMSRFILVNQNHTVQTMWFKQLSKLMTATNH